MGSVLSSSPGGLLTVAVIILASSLLYQRLLPRPLPGIPYNEAASRSLLGDVPEMMAYVRRTQRVFCWLTSLTTRHGSAVVQAFVKPLGARPWIVVTDPHESQDLLLRRTHEFDRSGFFADLIGGILPEQHIQFPSDDARFRANRRLINHLMAPAFVAAVSAPEAYRSVAALIRIWQAKCDAARGRPFEAHLDIKYAALDFIFMSSFGMPAAEGITAQRLDAVQRREVRVPVDVDTPAVFPEGRIPDVFAAVLTLEHSVMSTQLSPAPALTSWVLRQLPYMKKAIATKDAYIRARVEACVRLMEEEKGHTDNARSALHSVLLRERELAAAAGRPPAYHARAIADEFFGFMLAGHDTTATAVAWGVKYLSEHGEVQAQLRDALHAALPAAAASAADEGPSYAALARARVPYLDAVVAEVLRHASPIDFVVRRARCDAVVLGRRVPAGTDVFLMANGPGYLAPGLVVPAADRSPGARPGHHALTGLWDDADVAAFRPERWLAAVPDPATGEKERFDPQAGPSLAFGLGPRGCFGRRLALQHLRIQFALLVWHFNLLPVPEALGGHEAVQRFAREPTQCYVRLERAAP